MKSLLLTVSSFALTSLSLVFLFGLYFCILSHFEIIRCIVKSLISTSNYFLLKYNCKKKTWKVFFWVQEFGCPNCIILVSQMTWICHCIMIMSLYYVTVFILNCHCIHKRKLKFTSEFWVFSLSARSSTFLKACWLLIFMLSLLSWTIHSNP